MFRKAPVARFLMAASAVKSVEDKGYVHTYENTGAKEKSSELLFRRSELPIYQSVHAVNNAPSHSKDQASSIGLVGAIEGGFRTIRESLQSVKGSVNSQLHYFDDFIETGKGHISFVTDYLNEEDKTLPRIGAVAVGGAAGFIFGLRGGFFKRLIYTSVGAGSIASICYPKEAKQYTELALAESRKGANVVYNFVLGVKPEDAHQKQLALPEFPTTVDELKNSFSKLGSSIYKSISFGEK